MMAALAKKVRIELIICLFLITAMLLAYGQVIGFEFINYDDPIYVTDNPHVKAGLTSESIIWAFTTTHDGNRLPLTWLSHMVDIELYGVNPGGHHWTNLLIHMANTVLIFAAFKLMTGALWRSAFVAALFALHPLHVESVTWVAERKDVLSTFWGMLVIIVYYRYAGQPRLMTYLPAILFLCIGLMAKPMLVTIPFILLLLDYWPLKRIEPIGADFAGKGMVKFRRLFQLIAEKIPLFIVIAISSVVTFWAQKSGGGVKSLEVFPPSVRIANALVSYVDYLAKSIWPRGLAVFYPHPGDSLPLWQVLGATLLIAGITVWALRSYRKIPYLAVGWLWFIVTLVPVIGLVQVGEQAMADRYTYIPLIGIFIIFAWGTADLIASWKFHMVFPAIGAVILLSALTARTFQQVSYWENSITLFTHVLEVTEKNIVAHNNLGTALYDEGEIDRAIYHYQKAIEINPRSVAALYSIGRALTDIGKTDVAIDYYNQALKIDPEHPGAHNNLANLLVAGGRLEEAFFHYREALKNKPDYSDAHNNLANLLALQGRFNGAVLHYERALAIDPADATAHCNLGIVLKARGRLNGALAHFAEAIRLYPGYAEAYYLAGLVIARQGKYKQARAFFSKALEINPDYEEARRTLENMTGRFQPRGERDSAE